MQSKETSKQLECVCTFEEIMIEPTFPCPVFNISQCNSCLVKNDSLNCTILSIKSGNSMCLLPNKCYPSEKPNTANLSKTVQALLYTIVPALIFIAVYMAFVLYKKRRSGQAEISVSTEMISMENECFNYGSFE